MIQALTDSDVLRELAWMSLEDEPPPEHNPLLTEAQFDQEVELAAAGQWEELGLDPLPEGWRHASIDELRDAA